jgi:diguanylate cyclase (GGDEF)-like protein
MIDTFYEQPDRHSLRSAVDRALASQGPRLRFPKVLEDAYDNHAAALKTRRTCMAMVLCIAVFNLGLLIDYRFNPALFWDFLFLRVFVTSIPVLGLVWVSQWLKPYRRRDWVTAAGLAWGGFMMNVLIEMRGAGAGHLAFSIGLFIIVANIVFHLRPIVAMSLSGTVCVITSAFVMRQHLQIEQQDALAIGFLVAAAAITLIANYRLEITMRHLFLMILRDQMRMEDVQRQNQQLSAYSFTDGLTGIANRRRFDLEMEAACDEALATCDTVALLLVDVDNFKHYNDTHGHPAGDVCLHHVAQVLATQISSERDLAARVGGEEFALLLRAKTYDHAEQIAERIHTALAGQWPAHIVPSTVSIGLAFITAPHKDMLMKAADKALYEAKAGGRNRTVAHARAA